MGDGCLNYEHFEELGGILKGKLEEHFKNQQLRQGEFYFLSIKTVTNERFPRNMKHCNFWSDFRSSVSPIFYKCMAKYFHNLY